MANFIVFLKLVYTYAVWFFGGFLVYCLFGLGWVCLFVCLFLIFSPEHYRSLQQIQLSFLSTNIITVFTFLLCTHVVLEELHELCGSRQYCNYIELEFFLFSKKIW